MIDRSMRQENVDNATMIIGAFNLSFATSKKIIKKKNVKCEIKSSYSSVLSRILKLIWSWAQSEHLKDSRPLWASCWNPNLRNLFIFTKNSKYLQYQNKKFNFQ